MVIEGGSRLLQRAIKGLAPMEAVKKTARVSVRERLGEVVRVGRGEEGRKGREEVGGKRVREEREAVGERRRKNPRGRGKLQYI